MIQQEIVEHLESAHFHINEAIDELSSIGAFATKSELYNIKHRIEELKKLFDLENES